MATPSSSSASSSLRSTTAMIQPITNPRPSVSGTTFEPATPTVPFFSITGNDRCKSHDTPWGLARRPIYHPYSTATAAAPTLSTRWPFATELAGRYWSDRRDVRSHQVDTPATRTKLPQKLLNLFDDSQVPVASASGQRSQQQGRAEGKRVMDPSRLANEVQAISSSSSSSDEREWQDRGDQASTSSNLSTAQSQDDSIQPFWLDKIPDSRAGHLFAQYQAKYWRMKQRGANMPIKFFNPQRGELETAQEQAEFRTLARRFRMRLPNRNERRLAKNQEYKLRRFGPAGRGNKTPQQMKATRVASLRNYLLQKLRLLVEEGEIEARRLETEGDLTKEDGRKKPKRGPEWTHDNELDLMMLDAFAPFKSGDPILELYKLFLRRSGRSSCIELPP